MANQEHFDLLKQGVFCKLIMSHLDTSIIDIEKGWPALIRNTRHIGDFTCRKDHDAYQKGFERLLRDLKAKA